MAWPTSNFPTSLDTITDKSDGVDDVVAADINGVYDCIEKIEAKVGITGSAVATSHDYRIAQVETISTNLKALSDNFFASGRKIWIYENAAPTGWTLVAAAADAVLAVKGGSNAFKVNGGNQAGTWTQPNHNHTTPNHSHPLASDAPASYFVSGVDCIKKGNYIFSPFAGGEASVEKLKWNTTSSGSGTSGGSATANTWRPLAQVGIIISKD